MTFSPSQPIPTGRQEGTARGLAASFGTSFRSPSPLAHESLARDLEECSDGDDKEVGLKREEDGSDSEGGIGPSLYRAPSGIAFGATRPSLSPGGFDEAPLTRLERTRSLEEERSLLHDNHILPNKEQVAHFQGPLGAIYRRIFGISLPRQPPDAEAPRIVVGLSETSPLLGKSVSIRSTPENLKRQWEEAVAAGQIKTTWQREARTIAVYSRSLVVTFLLQYSLNATPIFTVGRLGTLELGAVSLASMTANITCYCPIQGLATSLDTLCGQAYGSGHKQLVGLQLQRMIYFLLLILVPIAAIWLSAEPILAAMIEPQSAALAASYLRIILLGAPAYAVFEAGKRFVQAQGLFHATTYVLLVAAPTNILLNWLFVWKLGWGFNGAPVAVAITQNMLPLFLFLYVWLVDGSEAWGGFRRAAFRNWGPMVRLALPGMVMVVAEWFAFEILTLASGRIGIEYMAAQSALVAVTSTLFQIPFPLSVAGSTRVANLIGAQLVDAAKTSARVTFASGLIVGLFNLTLLLIFRNHIPALFTRDSEVIELIAKTLPICAVMHLFDCVAAMSHGLLRGIGRQEFGGYANLACYYLVGLPISLGLGFGLDWEITGLWTGVTFALFLVSMVEYWFIWASDWDRAAHEAETRNAAG
ncbi:mate-domain-containing protein [Lasiosphaeria miniovina]|uniref:Mate-domain-containing protein n=1 Tax=Lasiosphaeria miniovina TaxID=1954250 RepID=A0AA40AUH0_9PEZI|nr:mate-domain-containing protein [Lasiosphaeria miniovina]KAK0722172.1 mate-domain-containing protein [Lasiosphaeria miniovina]